MRNKMTGIILMIIGGLLFGAGIVIYNSSNKTKNNNTTERELEKAIEMAIADGVLTDNERELIKSITIEKGLDYNVVIKDVERQLSELKIDSETELIDYVKKSGDDFEKFIVQKFDQKYYRIKEWAGDKYVNGVYADTTPQPDLLIELKYKTVKFSVECKWRQKTYKGGIQFASKEQLKRYRNYAKHAKIPVFIAIGLGGKGDKPKHLFIVPIENLYYNFLYLNQLEKYEKKVDSDFYFDTKTMKLR